MERPAHKAGWARPLPVLVVIEVYSFRVWQVVK